MNKTSLRLPIIIFLLSAGFYFYQFLVQVSLGVVSDSLMQDLSLKATMLGVISSAFYYLYVILQLPVGFVLDRYSTRKILFGTMLLFSVSIFIFAVSHNILILVLMRIFMGAFSAFAFVGALVVINNLFPLRFYSLMAGITEMMGALGAIFGTALFAMATKYYPWREVFVVLSILGVILALLIRYFMRDERNHHQNKLQQSISLLSQITYFKSVLANKQIVAIAMYAFLLWAPVLIFASLWGIPFLDSNHQLNLAQAASAIAFIWLGIAIGSPLLGWLSEKIKLRRVLLIVGALIGLIGSAIVIYMDNLSWFAISGWLFLIGLSAGVQTISFAITRDNSEKSVRGVATAFVNMAAVLSGILLQPLAGILLDLHAPHTKVYSSADYRFALVIIPACYILALITSIFFIKETRCQCK